MSGPYQRPDLFYCGAGRLRVANNCKCNKTFRMLLVMVYGDDDHYHVNKWKALKC